MQLGEVLKRMAELLVIDNDPGHWAEGLLRFAQELERHDEDDVKRDISRCFGGSGSLNDTWLIDPARNREFRMLLDKLYEMSHDRKRYVQK